jgi:uncharacterized low-complexity protein
MKNSNVSKRFGALLTGTLMTGAIAGSTANASELIAFDDLGTGGELRAELLSSVTSPFKSPEAKCGEGKCGEEKSSSTTSETKAAEHKCGEGKCGEGKCGGDSKEGQEVKSTNEAGKATEAPRGRKKELNNSNKKTGNNPN